MQNETLRFGRRAGGGSTGAVIAHGFGGVFKRSTPSCPPFKGHRNRNRSRLTRSNGEHPICEWVLFGVPSTFSATKDTDGIPKNTQPETRYSDRFESQAASFTEAFEARAQALRPETHHQSRAGLAGRLDRPPALLPSAGCRSAQGYPREDLIVSNEIERSAFDGYTGNWTMYTDDGLEADDQVCSLG